MDIAAATHLHIAIACTCRRCLVHAPASGVTCLPPSKHQWHAGTCTTIPAQLLIPPGAFSVPGECSISCHIDIPPELTQ